MRMDMLLCTITHSDTPQRRSQQPTATGPGKRKQEEINVTQSLMAHLLLPSSFPQTEIKMTGLPREVAGRGLHPVYHQVKSRG